MLGSSPDLVYPPENAKLAARISEQDAVVTEFAPGAQPEADNLPARNRISSGLSLGVRVTEAPEGSGALITTRFASDQGRDVFAAPGNATSRGSLGCARLIQPGAKPVIEPLEVTTELDLYLAPQQLKLREALPENPIEARLLGALEAAGDPQHVDELRRATGLPAAGISGALVMMELKGLTHLVGPMTSMRTR
jgi:DNA processing protein